MDYGIYANMTGEEKLPYALGGIVIAGLVYLVVAALVQLVGVHRVMQFLPPVVTGPIIMVFGLSLAPSAINNASSNWLLAFLAVAVIVEVNLWGEGMIKIVPVLMGILLPYVVALVTKQVDFSGVAQAKWVGAPPIVMAKFDLTAVLVMAPIAVASIVEHVGNISAISETVGENFIEDPGLQRTLLGDGVATAVAGLFGAPANTTYGENISVLEMTHIYDPRVIRIAAVYTILLSFSPKFAALINTIPTAILGGVSFILYGMLAAIGVRHIVENRVDFTNPRNLIIIAVVLVSGVGFEAWGDGYQNVGMTFTLGNASITLPAVAIAAIAGIALNIILPGRDYEFGSDVTGGHSGSMGRY
jgi:uracil permease